jgi:glutaredoxin
LAARPHLVVYSRAYCHLCDDMVAALIALQPRHGFSLEVVDVDADPELEARYDLLVPVLTVNGDEICHYFLDDERLAATLGDG